MSRIDELFDKISSQQKTLDQNIKELKERLEEKLNISIIRVEPDTSDSFCIIFDSNFIDESALISLCQLNMTAIWINGQDNLECEITIKGKDNDGEDNDD